MMLSEGVEKVVGDVKLNAQLESFVTDLKQNKINGSYTIARNTLTLMQKIVESDSWKTASELKDVVLKVGKYLIHAQPSESAIENMVRRVLKLIREECTRSVKGTEVEQEDSLQKMLLSADGANVAEVKEQYPNFSASELTEVINELIAEMEASTDNIAAQALEHIHTNEVIMTAGKSKTVEAFLKKAASKKRKFQVIVVECAPFFHGHELGLSLAQEGIETTVITDSAVFAMMSRVNKVIVGTRTVLANGGLKAISGMHAIALAAKYYSVPFVVCGALFKLSPQYLRSYDQESFNKFVSPESVLPYSEGELIHRVQVYNPVFDYVPPELVTLFISQIGGNAPFYIYRLVSELYSAEDQELCLSEFEQHKNFITAMEDTEMDQQVERSEMDHGGISGQKLKGTEFNSTCNMDHYDISELNISLDKAKARMDCTSKNPLHHPCKWLLHHRAHADFDLIMKHGEGIMVPYIEDAHGDTKSPISGRLKSLLFSALPFRRGKRDDRTSSHGRLCLHLDASTLLKDCRIFFAAFCESYKEDGSKHRLPYVTLVLTKPKSKADICCSKYLKLLDANDKVDNPFLFLESDGAYVSNQHFVQVLYTENVDILQYLMKSLAKFEPPPEKNDMGLFGGGKNPKKLNTTI